MPSSSGPVSFTAPATPTTKPGNNPNNADNMGSLTISGDFTTLVGTVQCTKDPDGTTSPVWFSVPLVRSDTNAIELSPTLTNAMTRTWNFDLPPGVQQVRFNATAIATGTCRAQLDTMKADGIKAIGTTLASVPVGNQSIAGTLTITSTGATALTVGANGSTNPVLQVDASTGSVATGIKVTGAAAAGGVALQVISSNATEALTIDAKAGAVVTIAGAAAGATGLTVGSATSASTIVMNVTSTNANGFVVGRQGTTNPCFQVDCSTATNVTGVKITGAASGAGVAMVAISSAGAENFTIDAKGTGVLNLAGTSTGQVYVGRGAAKTPVLGLTKTDVNSQNAAPTMAQWLGGYITHNSQTGAGTLTTPTGANIDAGMALTAATNDSFLVFYVNRGNQTVTLTAGDGNVTIRGTAAIPTLKATWILFARTGAGTWDVSQVLSA